MKKRRKPTSNISRAMAICRENGWRSGIVERRATATMKLDLFGFADILVVGRSKPLLIQACATSARYPHLRTIAKCAPAVADCLASGIDIQLWTWAKRIRNGRLKWTRGPIAHISSAQFDRTEHRLALMWFDDAGASFKGHDLITVPAPEPKKRKVKA